MQAQVTLVWMSGGWMSCGCPKHVDLGHGRAPACPYPVNRREPRKASEAYKERGLTLAGPVR